MKSEAILLCSNIYSRNDSNIATIAGFLGVKYSSVQIDDSQPILEQLRKNISDKVLCLVMSATTLSTILQSTNYSADVKNFLFQQARFLFIYGFYPTDSEKSVVNYLTDGLVPGLSNLDSCNYEYQVSSDSKDITRQFLGISFGPINNKTDFTFDINSNSSECENIITINNKPLFLKVRKNKCSLFLLSSNQVVDINKTIDANSSFHLKAFFSQIIPPMMFLRFVFKDRCWHHDVNYANFIIDDPLLKESYGFLNYRHLLKTMDQHNFASTIAFIPWNYKRTKKNIANLFRQRSDRFSISVHGCDHTEGEFGITDTKELNSRIKMATNKMDLHEQLSGVQYDKVMIFPQGVFSTKSMELLKANNYMAAVNSGPFPSDLRRSNILQLSDLLDIAIMKYKNFPLFLRRYPEDMVDFVFDSFLGKPILIVEHHGFFRKGYSTLGNFAQTINNSTGEKIHWKSLKEIFNNAYLQKKVSDNTVYCRLYTNHTIIKNKYEQSHNYVIMKNESEDVPIEKVSVNGNIVPYDVDNNLLSFSVKIISKGSAEIRITYKNENPYVNSNKEFRRTLSVYMRRYLSEFRDNFLSKNEILLSLSKKVLTRFKRKK